MDFKICETRDVRLQSMCQTLDSVRAVSSDVKTLL
jgi:hypothetical protein